MLVPQCFCIVVLQSAGLNFWCAWLSGCDVVAKITSVVSNRKLAVDGKLRRGTCIVHDSVCLSDEAALLTCKYASASLVIFVTVSKVRANRRLINLHVHVHVFQY